MNEPSPSQPSPPPPPPLPPSLPPPPETPPQETGPTNPPLSRNTRRWIRTACGCTLIACTAFLAMRLFPIGWTNSLDEAMGLRVGEGRPVAGFETAEMIVTESRQLAAMLEAPPPRPGRHFSQPFRVPPRPAPTGEPDGGLGSEPLEIALNISRKNFTLGLLIACAALGYRLFKPMTTADAADREAERAESSAAGRSALVGAGAVAVSTCIAIAIYAGGLAGEIAERRAQLKATIDAQAIAAASIITPLRVAESGDEKNSWSAAERAEGPRALRDAAAALDESLGEIAVSYEPLRVAMTECAGVTAMLGAALWAVWHMRSLHQKQSGEHASGS